jgi:hypothetical protein
MKGEIMLISKEDVVYYKVKLKKLFEQAKKHDIDIELKESEVLFVSNIGERAGVRILK